MSTAATSTSTSSSRSAAADAAAGVPSGLGDPAAPGEGDAGPVAGGDVATGEHPVAAGSPGGAPAEGAAAAGVAPDGSVAAAPAGVAPDAGGTAAPAPPEPRGWRGVPRAVLAGVGSAGRKVLGPLLVACGFVGIWYGITYLALEPTQRFLLPPPHEVVTDGFLDATTREQLISGLWSTTRVAMLGLLCAFLLGSAFAIFMAQARWIERSFYPYAVVLQTIPVLALTPLVGLWFGFNFRSRVLICLILALFPIITNTLFGLRSTAKAHHELFTLHDAGRWTRLVRLQLPSALPSIFTGLRISAGLSVIGAIVADFFFRQGEKGIGRLLDVYRSQLASDKLIAAVMCSATLGVAVFLAVTALSNRALRSWHDSATQRP